MAVGGWIALPAWTLWGEVTRLHGSAMIAFRAELERTESISSAEEINLTDGSSSYKAFVKDYRHFLEDWSVLHAWALVQYYSIVEMHIRYASHITENSAYHLLSSRPDFEEMSTINAIALTGGIEAWSEAIMRKCGQPWSRVYKGKAGLIEVSIVRNALVHGIRTVTPDMVQNATKRGAVLPFRAGEEARIRFDLLNEYRGRLRSFGRTISDGLVRQFRKSR